MVERRFTFVYVILALSMGASLWASFHLRTHVVVQRQPFVNCTQSDKAVADCIKTQMKIGGVGATVKCHKLNNRRYICDLNAGTGGCGILDVRVSQTQVVVHTSAQASCH